MAVTLYRSTDTGAPVLPNVSSQRAIDNLKLILKACLVDGYGSKPAAGWSISHEVADGITFFNGQGHCNFSHFNNTAVIVHLMESITDPSTPVPGGSNRRSGIWYDGQSTTARQYITTQLFGTTANKHWFIVADDKTVIMYIGTHNQVDLAGASSNSVVLYIGEFYPVMGGTGFVCLGGNMSTGMNLPTYLFAISTFGGTALRHPLTGLTDQGVQPGYRAWGPSGPHTNGNTYSNPTAMNLNPQVLQLVRAGVGAVGVGFGTTNSGQPAFVGHLRGLMVDSPTGYTSCSEFLKMLGVTTPVAADRMQTYTVGTKEIIPLYISVADSGSVISLDPTDWVPLWS